MKVMFAVRVRLVRSSLGPASTCIEDPRVRTSSVASRSARSERSYRVRHRRLESWTSSQERRGLCQAPDTTSASRAQKVEDGTSSLFARKHTARKLEGLPFRAAIGDRQAVYWWLLGHELSFQAKSLGSRPRSSNRRAPDLQFHDGPGSDHARLYNGPLCAEHTVSLRCPGSWRPCCSAHVRRNVP